MAKAVWVIALLAMAVIPMWAQDVPIPGFDPAYIEIDGNVTCNQSEPFTDWQCKQTDGTLKGQIKDKWANGDQDILSPGSYVRPGSTLAKEDITNVYMSNNLEYLYVAEERRANNGNSSWHLILTQVPPGKDSAGNMVFTLKTGDKDIQICFPSGNDPSQKQMWMRTVTTDVAAPVQAANIWNGSVSFSTEGWDPASPPFPFMVNSSRTTALADAVNSKGITTLQYEPACFAEAAIPLTLLGVTDVCNYKAYVTILTRSSCSTTSDVKDFAGPVYYSFGGATVKLSADVDKCTNEGCFTATISGGIPPYKVQWYVDGSAVGDPITLAEGVTTNKFCRQGADAFAAGTHTVKVVVTDKSASLLCAATGEVSFDTFDILSLKPTAPTITCQSGSGKLDVTGGLPPYTIKCTDCCAGAEHSYTFTASPSTPWYSCDLCHNPQAQDAPWEVGAHTFKVEVSDANACSNNGSVSFDIYAKPYVSLSQPVIACDGTGTITATVTQHAPAASALDIRWFEGTTELTGMAGKTVYSGDVTDPATGKTIWSVGTHKIKVAFRDSVGCTCESSVMTFPVYDGLTVTLTPGTPDCIGGITWTAAASGGSANYGYLWSVDDGPFSAGSATLDYTPAYPAGIDCATHKACVKATDTHDGITCETDPVCRSFSQKVDTQIPPK